jgi:hypothetical protein
MATLIDRRDAGRQCGVGSPQIVREYARSDPSGRISAISLADRVEVVSRRVTSSRNLPGRRRHLPLGNPNSRSTLDGVTEILGFAATKRQS